MKNKYISQIADLIPEGFEYMLPTKRDLLAYNIVLLSGSIDDALAVMGEFVNRVFGIIVTQGDKLVLNSLTPKLSHLIISREMVPKLFQITTTYLLLIEKQKHLLNRYDILEKEKIRFVKQHEELRDNYNYAISKLEQKIEDLRKEVNRRKKVENDLYDQNTEYAKVNEKLRLSQQELLEKSEELVENNEELLKARLRAEESDRLKSEFIHNMSHEIRTPMNGIIGFAQFLNDADLAIEKRKHYVNIIQNSGNQLLRIIDDILEISQLGTKQVKLLEEEVNLYGLFLELFSIFDLKAKENKTPLYLERGLPEKQSIILADQAKLNKILSNLLENALKFTNTGYIEFGYKLVDNSSTKELEIYVKDTGVGVSPDKQALIFERFSQEDEEVSKSVGGLGLGLSIAKENTELLGGRITVESEKGKGSLFKIVIPYRPVFEEKKHEKGVSTRRNNNHSILVVEDEEVNYLYFETLLQDVIKVDCKVVFAKNGQVAVDICKSNPDIEIVFMDLKMPVMNGFDATKKIRKNRSELPIIAQSAYSTNEDKDKALEAGCNDFLTKPVDVERLRDLLDQHLGL